MENSVIPLWMGTAAGLSILPTGCVAKSQQGNLFELKTPAGLVVVVSADRDSINKQHGPRFENNGRVLSLSYKGKSFLSEDGLVDETGIKEPYGPLGYKNAVPGGHFVKVGVGVLKKEKKGNYRFQDPYEVVHYHPIEVRPGKNEISFTETANFHPKWKYQYSKKFKVADDSLIIEYLLLNTGTDTIVSEQYNHNWFSFPKKEKTNYMLVPDFAPLQLANGPFVLQSSELISKAPSKKPSFLEFNSIRKPASNKLLLDNGGWGKVDISGNFSVARFAVYAQDNSICPEIFYRHRVAPGSQVSWKRIYKFTVR